MKKLYIVGCGGFGREVLWLAGRINNISPTWDIKGFIDDNEQLHGTMQDDFPVVGGIDWLKNLSEDVWVVIAIGSARIKKNVVQKLSEYPYVHFAILIDPSVIISDRVQVGEGSIICAGTIITVDISIGRHVILNLDCTVGHDAVLGDYVTVYPSVNISGNVTVGNESELGTGMQILQGKRICERVIFGAGAVVVRDVIDPGTYAGVPVKMISE